MCGRFALTTPIEVLRQLFGFTELVNLPPRYNIAPTQTAPVVRRARDGSRRLHLLRWGLVPSWASDVTIGNRLINARGETVDTLAAFREAFRRRRCLVLADGFYEWRREGRRKLPHHISLAGGGPFAFAGLWERWNDGSGPLDSFTIVTTAANDLLRSLHDRMPVMLDPDEAGTWLNGTVEQTAALIRPFPDARMVLRPVSSRVNSPKDDDARCLAPPETDEPSLSGAESLSMGRLL